MFAEGTTTEIFARIYGLYMLAAGIGVIINVKPYRDMLTEVRQAALVPFLAGVIAFAVGAVTLSIHNDWSNWAAIAISIIGWGALIKGVLLLAIPSAVFSFSDVITKSDTIMRAWGVIVAIIGAALLYVGFA